MIPEGLDQLTTVIADATGLRTTRDPSKANPPCILVGAPAITSMTMGAVVVGVPVELIADGIGDLDATNWLVTHMPAVLNAIGSNSAEPSVYDADDLRFPSMKSTATLTIRNTP